MQRNLKILPHFDAHDTIKEPGGVEELWINFEESSHIFAGIGETFRNLKWLGIGDVYSNHIGLIARSDFANLKKLVRLQLSHNPIKFATDDVFADLEALEELKIRRCNIRILPKNLFKHLKNLRVLDLSYNKLTNLHKNLFANNLKLEYFHLFDNELKIIDVDFTKFLSIEKIDLHNNICSNEIYWPVYPEDSTVSSVKELQEKLISNCSECVL